MILRHQLAVLQRHQARRPNLNRADRTSRDPVRRDTEGAAPGAAAAGYPDTIVGWHAAAAILACDFFTAGLLDGTPAHVLP